MRTLALLLLAGCAGPPAFVTEGGVAFRFDVPDAGFTREAMSATEDSLAIALLNRDILGAHESIRGADVTVVADNLRCTSAHVPCDGFEDGSSLYIVTYDCPGASAYAHELTHLILLRTTGDADAQHLNASAWGAVTYVEEQAWGACLKQMEGA